MFNKTIILLLVLSLIYAIFVTIRCNNLRNNINSIEPDTILINSVDTIYDTVYIKKPVPEYIIQKEYVSLPCDGDSINIPISEY
jgi:hypothetical protein